MSEYRYRSALIEAPACCQFVANQPWAADALTACPTCDGRVYRVIGRVGFQFRHGMRGDMRDYREDMARFPNDPECHVDGPASVKRLLETRKRRDGWQVTNDLADLHDTNLGRSFKENPEVNSKAFIRKCFEEAKAENFSLPDD